MNRLFYLMITLVFTSQIALSQDTLGVNIAGSIDVYYRYNLQRDFDESPATAFANLPGFALGMANLKISKEGDEVGFMVDLVAGPRGEDATFLSPFLRPGGNSSLVNQLYAYWDVTEEIKVTLGNFNTFLGYEVISPLDNINYSTSYLFSYGPFSHTGIKLDYANSNGVSLMVGVFNPTDATEFNPTDDYAYGAQVGYSFGNGSIFLNSIYSDDFYQFDLTGGVDVTDGIYVGLNASKAKNAFTGAAAYLKIAASPKLDLGARIEYFVDEGLGLFSIDESVIDFTISANYKVGNLTIIPEYRIDITSEGVFVEEENTEENLSSLVIGVVYGF